MLYLIIQFAGMYKDTAQVGSSFTAPNSLHSGQTCQAVQTVEFLARTSGRLGTLFTPYHFQYHRFLPPTLGVVKIRCPISHQWDNNNCFQNQSQFQNYNQSLNEEVHSKTDLLSNSNTSQFASH